MIPDESLLWNHLDECGINFRASQSRLVEMNGSKDSGWTNDLFYCPLKTDTPFIDYLSHPLMFQFQSTTMMQAQPSTLFGYIRKSNDPLENFAFAMQSLPQIFGKGRDGASSNTVSRIWDMGFAQIRATVFPEELNRHFGQNNRHDTVIGSKTECSIIIETAWRTPLTNEQHNWLKTYQPLFQIPDPDVTISDTPKMVRSFSHDWPTDCPTPKLGFGLSGDEKGLIHIQHPKLANILSVNWIRSITQLSILPARGGAESAILVNYAPIDQDHQNTHDLPVVWGAGDPYQHNSLAAAFAERLGVPLHKQEYLNI